MYCVELTFGRGKLDGTSFAVEKIQPVTTRILNAFANYFNGARAYSSWGSYKTKDGQVVLGPSTTIFSYTQTIQNLESALNLLASQVATELEQECTLLTITELKGEMHWVQPDPLCLLCQ